jgi:hypothetical protein
MRTIFLPLLLASAAATAQTAQIPAVSVDTLKTVTKTLSSDEYEGRAPTTPGETRISSNG